MNKMISIKENASASQSLVKGRVNLRNRIVRERQSTWVSRKDISANPYFVKTRPVSEWYTDTKIHTSFIKYDQQFFKQVIIGSKAHQLCHELDSIAEQIEDAKELLTYSADWDDEGSLPTNEVVFNNAINFLVSYSNFIYQNYSNTILSVPYIDITREGGISILWENAKAKFLIIFKNTDSKVAFFFGERTDTKIPFKSAIEINGPVDESIASWMKTNLA